MSNLPRENPDRFDWLSKARSRLWAKQSQSLQKIPPLALFVGTFVYSGLSPFASGTVGSFLAALLYYFVHPLQQIGVLSVACALVLILGIWASNVIERSAEIKDAGFIVIDEVLGQWLALFTWVYTGHPVFIAFAFAYFRFFDIVKLWPARYFEKQPGGTGVMLDDAVAGIYANLAAHLTMAVFMRLNW